MKTSTYKPKEATERVIMHIDYDSFFASVEQQVNPELRGKPIVVGGSSVRKGIVCAASREAKQYGIKTAMPLYEAIKLCPELISIRGDGSKYSYIQKETLKIFNKYTDLVEPFSIDEAFLDITGTWKLFNSPEDVAYKIKNNIKEAFGEYITCSIGIGPNKLVAKLVSDIDKPNGLVVVTKENLQQILQRVELRDFCGIGSRTEFKLNNLGITTVKKLQEIPLEFLYKNFGNVTGSFLYNACRGLDVSKVKTADHKRIAKSMSHQHTLMTNTKDHKILLNNIRRLTEMVAKRLRNQNMLGKTLHLSLRDKNRKTYVHRKSLRRYTDSGTTMFKEIEELFNNLNWKKETRLIGVGITDLINEKYKMTPLFLEDKKDEKINKTIDEINNKFGKFTIIPANTMKADNTKNKISSFLKHE